jgi:hypothetical protein
MTNHSLLQTFGDRKTLIERQRTTTASSRPGIASVVFCKGWLPRSAHAKRYVSIWKEKKMIIQFPDIHAPDPETFGIAFPADVDGQRIRCVITIEALQDLDPSNAMDTAENQYEFNKAQIQSIAEEKIRNGQIQNGQLLITDRDVR